jgi:uncharacterized membrane protein
MLILITGLALFFLVHLVPTQPDLRQGLVSRFGAMAYQALFSIASLAGLALIVVGYGKLQVMAGKNPEIWTPPTALRHVSLLLMIPAMILLVAAYLPSNIRARVKHPMLLAVKLWAVSHLLANGDLASIVLFGSFLVWATYDLKSVKARGALGPLGRAEGKLWADAVAVVAGLAIYGAAILFLHERLFGVAPVVLRFAP